MEEVKTIRSSLVSAAVGLSGTMSRWDCYQLLAHGVEKPPSAHLQSLFGYGIDMEPTAVAHVESVVGELFFYTGDRQKSRKRGQYTATPDGVGVDALCEVKSRSPTLGPYDVGDKHWTKYMPQVQQQMWVLDYQQSYFSCYCHQGSSRVWRIHRSEKYLTQLHELLDDFWAMLRGEKECPKRIGRRPKMPLVEWELIDGPEQEGTNVEADLIASLAKERAAEINFPKELDALEEELLAKYPGESEAILRGTQPRRDFLLQDIPF